MTGNNIAQDSRASKFGSTEVSKFCFFLYLCFIVDFFIHFSARIPGLGAIRPTLLLIVFIIISLYSQRSRFKERGRDPIYAAVVALIIYIIVSTPFTTFPGSVVRGNFVEFLKAVVFFFFTALCVDNEKRLKTTISFFMWCQVFRVMEPLYLHFTQGYWGGATFIGGEFSARLSGAPRDVINPNELGFVIATVIPYLHYVLFPSGKTKALIYFALMPLLIYALILTMSRGGVVALAVVAWMVFKESKHKAFLIIIGLCACVAAWSVMSPVQKDRYLSLISSDTQSSATVDGRMDGMWEEFRIGFERPVFGHGLGTTLEAKVHDHGRGNASHNFYAELVIEIGLVGAIFMFRYLRHIYRRFKDNKEILAELNLLRNDYYTRLNMAMTAVFWMQAVYSINYFGLSVYYWYFFGGLTIAYGRVLVAYKNTLLNSHQGSANAQ